MTLPRVCVLKTDGINRDAETAFAFELAGATPKVVHVNQLRQNQDQLHNYQILAIPGGFSYGDDIAAGKVLAVELFSYLRDQVQSFVESGGIVLGICNGFQVLVRTGLLPFCELGKQKVTLAPNDSGHFECRWVKMKVESSHSVFTKGCEGQIWEVPISHGEGRLSCEQAAMQEIESKHLVTLRFVDEQGNETMQYPDNPNGSPHAITGLTDVTGRIFGLMPHPECFVLPTQHPNWRRRKAGELPHGIFIFQNAVRAAA